MEIINTIPTHSLHNVGRRIKEYYLSAYQEHCAILCVKFNASVPAGTVNSECLSEGGNMFHCITLCSCTGVTGQMMSDVLFLFHA